MILLTMSVRNDWQGVGGRRGTGDAVSRARGIGHLHLAMSGKHAQQSAIQHGQIVDDEIELSRQMSGPIGRGTNGKRYGVNW